MNLQLILNYLILKSEVDAIIEDLPKELEKCVNERHNLINKNNRRELTLKIKECEAKGDLENLQKFLEEFNNLTKNNKKEDEIQTQKGEVTQSSEEVQPGEDQSQEASVEEEFETGFEESGQEIPGQESQPIED